jgi:hypothetical protein
MTKREVVNFRMNELEVSKLDYIRQPGETRSAAIRRLISDAWADANMAFDADNRFNVTDYLPPNI